VINQESSKFLGANDGWTNLSCPYDQLSGTSIEKFVLLTFDRALTLEIDNDIAITTASIEIDIKDNLI